MQLHPVGRSARPRRGRRRRRGARPRDLGPRGAGRGGRGGPGGADRALRRRRRPGGARAPGCAPGRRRASCPRATGSRCRSRTTGRTWRSWPRRWGTDVAGVVARHTRDRVRRGVLRLRARASPTCPGCRRSSPYPGWSRRARGCRPGRSAWPAAGAASTRPRRRAGGGCSGRTDATLWDQDARPAGAAAARAPGWCSSRDDRLHVLATGPLVTVQDRGRPGLAHLGVARAGALDAPGRRARQPDRRQRRRTPPCSRSCSAASSCAPTPAAGWRSPAPAGDRTPRGRVAPGRRDAPGRDADDRGVQLRRGRRRDRRAAGARLAVHRHARLGRAAPGRARRRAAGGGAARSTAGRSTPRVRRARAAAGARRSARRLVRRRRARPALRDAVRRRRGLQPDRAAPRRARRCRGGASDELPSEGMVLGAVQVPPSGRADRVPRRPPADRRLPGAGGRRRGRPVAVRAAAAGRAGAVHSGSVGRASTG